MRPIEQNPQFSNLLRGAASPYLRGHASDPVYWYPWGMEALARARAENKPILLSVGYMASYDCHVAQRELYQNVSIAAQMNRAFVNILMDREEYPQLDHFAMVARQLMTHEGGWPNHVILTPDLKPFYAGGKFGPDESYGAKSFPLLLDWLEKSWLQDEQTIRSKADEALDTIKEFVTIPPVATEIPPASIDMLASGLFEELKAQYDVRSGGFGMAPKFPYENYLSFLLTYHEYTGHVEAFDIVATSLGKMAAGGLYDHVGCGFHRLAVDREWYVPHFEKLLPTQAMLGRLYTDAARLTGNAYLADVARSIFDFVGGVFTDSGGAFYSAIDAELGQVAGAYYAWTAEELEKILTPEEAYFFSTFFALADIPHYPGHPAPTGQVIVARKPLYQAALEYGMPYSQMAALSGQVMNKLLDARNRRNAPLLDHKILVGSNGLMIDALAHAGEVFNQPRYVQRARTAADYLLEHAVDNAGRLHHQIVAGRGMLPATLEDYAYLIKGLITLARVQTDGALLESISTFAEQLHELFWDMQAPGYFLSQPGDGLPVRIKTADDGLLPNANAVMAQNWLHLYAITENELYRERAFDMLYHFLGDRGRPLSELATMIEAAIVMDGMRRGFEPMSPTTYQETSLSAARGDIPDDAISLSARLVPEDAAPGQACELEVVLSMKDGWFINAHQPRMSHLVPTEAQVYGVGVELVGVEYPAADAIASAEIFDIYQGDVALRLRLLLHPNPKGRPPIQVALRLQPGTETSLYPAREFTLVI